MSNEANEKIKTAVGLAWLVLLLVIGQHNEWYAVLYLAASLGLYGYIEKVKRNDKIATEQEAMRIALESGMSVEEYLARKNGTTLEEIEQRKRQREQMLAYHAKKREAAIEAAKSKTTV